ncbi:hypothetical protein [Thioalkalivibrio sulfidiphilus]|uniref:hypothetical protein n=1 Tax=Thioalkalivibrio sulfidiphilus TaxID=1033854 RepID=UPI00035D436E|nr:hypothetical protein [Thioalkalivibrio sulfidiphilus]
MLFRLPGFKATTTPDGIPTQPSKLRRWLEALPMVNMGEATRQFYEGLRSLNKAELSPVDRLELMETLRPTAKVILAHLSRHFHNRTLPLPEKSRRIADLNRVLLVELGRGYRLAIVDLVQGAHKRQIQKWLGLACYRALRHTGDGVIHAWRLYTPVGQGVWHDIHELFAIAEKHGVHETPVPDDELHQRDRGTVSDAYIRLCVLGLSRPPALRQGEVDKLNDYLQAAVHSAIIVSTPMPDSANGVTLTDLSGDRGPVHVNIAELPEGPQVRLFNLTPLIHEIREHLQHGGKPRATDMSTDLMRRLLDIWTRSSKRRFSRAQRDDDMNVTMGLTNIHIAISEEQEQVYGPKDKPAQFGDLSLQPISDVHRADREGQFLAKQDALGGADAWDMVGRGNVVTESYLSEKARPATIRAIGLSHAEAETWQVLNASAGGFCLRWPGQQPTRAQVGELIGLREKEGSHYQWRVGVIRWMLNKGEQGLEIGVQVLAPKTLLITLEHAHMGQPSGDPVEALLLPAIKTIQQPPSLLAPTRRFRLGDQVIVNLAGRALRVKLSSQGEHTSLFTQFRYTSLGSVEQASPEVSSGGDTFDKVWTLI